MAVERQRQWAEGAVLVLTTCRLAQGILYNRTGCYIFSKLPFSQRRQDTDWKSALRRQNLRSCRSLRACGAFAGAGDLDAFTSKR